MSTTHHSGHAVERTAGRPEAGRAYTIGAAVCALFAVFFIPVVFGPIGAVLGFVGNAKGDRAGIWAALAAILATFVGVVLGAAVAGNR
ncbi:MAG TPA: hypothetical protein VHF47_00555 [Acidimicrobiales bacterium]|nr:hypothetical protein [Acidimicrobiales bacterium]